MSNEQKDQELESIGARRIKFYVLSLLRKMRDKLSVYASLFSLSFGGIVLLLYVLSVGQLPEFTLGDITGTLLAVTATTLLVGLTLVAYCLGAGYFARCALEAVYPEAALHKAGQHIDMSAAPYYERIIRGPFLLGATCFSVLIWLAAATTLIPNPLKPPYKGQLCLSLIITIGTLAALVLLDWKRIRRPIVSKILLDLFAGALLVVVVILTAWQVAPAYLEAQSVAMASANPPPFDWTPFLLGLLDHAVIFGCALTVCLAIFSQFRRILFGLKWCIDWVVRLFPVSRLQDPAKESSEPKKKFLNGEDWRLLKAKVYVICVFLFLPLVVFVLGGALAGMGDSKNWGADFLFAASLLTLLNWASFLVRGWKERVGLGMLTAALVLIFSPMMMQNPIFFPKALVGWLGLGNERLATIGLSGRQCATLAPYGVNCVPDDKQSITLTNVNLLNRLGASMVLELLVEDRASNYANSQDGHQSGGAPTHQKPKTAESQKNSLVAMTQMGLKSASAQRCDRLLLSQLEPGDATNVKALRCVELIVPRDQVAGYTVSSFRTYSGGYTAYQSAGLKDGTTKEK